MYSTRGMNDPEEMAVYIDLFKDYFKETYPEPNKMNLYRIEEWFDQHKRIFESPSYITAFSMEEDDAAQWERYGNRGQGVCIAFDFENLKRIAEYSEMRLQKITYDDGSSEPAFDEKLIEQMTEYMDSQSLPYGYETDNGFFQEIVGQACMYKGGFYKAERECRLALPAPLLER